MRAKLKGALPTDLRPVAQWFKSILLFVDPLAVHSGAAPLRAAMNWIAEYDEWFKGVSRAPEAPHMHLLYHRDLSIAGADVLSIAAELTELASFSKQLGLGFSISIGVEEALERPVALEALLATAAVTNVGFTIDAQAAALGVGAIARLIAETAEKAGQVALLGSMCELMNMGLLADPALNGLDLTIHPKNERLGRPPEVDPVLPCFARFRIIIGTDGDVYPCLGLVGLQECRLGSVFESFAQSALARGAPTLDLARLAEKGPTEIFPSDTTQRETGLPWACEQHRFHLQRASSASSSS